MTVSKEMMFFAMFAVRVQMFQPVFDLQAIGHERMLTYQPLASIQRESRSRLR